ncbi:hypothetical protein IPC241_21820 [Pseudomonas aeruginosa]|nr:hypothetical protein CDG78_29035 [Pseudomonas paraeruginosa]RQF84520.1 hypothetical protein IPC241_21820 [Pseudomonas aeruginosa]
MQIKGHERDSGEIESGTGTDGVEIHHSGREASDLYAVNPPFLDLYGTARSGHSISIVQPINTEYAACRDTAREPSAANASMATYPSP